MVRLGYDLSLQQQQKLIMTQELRQALAVLQLPVTELQGLIQQELLENPMLEIRDEGGSAPGAEPGETAPAEPSGETGGDEAWDSRDDETVAWVRSLSSSPGPGSSLRNGEEEEVGPPQPAPAPTLAEYLHEQLRLVNCSAAERRAAAFLIDSLDDNGYLTLSLAEAAQSLQLPEAVVERALVVVQGFDPPGVGSRSLQECLLLQWELLALENPLVPALIQGCLDDLAAGRITRIAAELNATPGEVQTAADLLRLLDPKPGRRFGREGEVRYLTPDVTVEQVGDQFVVLVNDTSVPRLTVSPSYRALLGDPDARQFLERKVHAAVWLIRAIEQRRLTLYRVTEAIVRHQKAFFLHGLRHLRPLTLREVADDLGIHESTVSRAVAGKYVQTGRGLFPLKFFFSSGVEGADGGVSAAAVKRMIRDLIAEENPRRPLSDQAIAQALTEKGVQISRRTVAKYREEAGIPSSSKRRRYD